MMCRDPALIIGFSPTRHCWAISSQDADLITRINFLGAAGRALGAVSAFATTCLLRKKCRDPGVVDEITCAAETSEEEEVKEYPKNGEKEKLAIILVG